MDETPRTFGTKELFVGLYAGFVVNLVGVALLNNGPGDPDAGTWLVTLGILNELYGVVLVATPELEPYGRRVAGWLGDRFRAVTRWTWVRVGRFLRLLGPITVNVRAASSIGLAGDLRVTLVRNPPPGASERDVVWWLVAQNKHAQGRLNALEGKIEDLPKAWRAEIAEVREELEGVSRQLVQAEADRRIEFRLIGVGFIVAGLLLTWVGSIV